jgi:hypothetical protein
MTRAWRDWQANADDIQKLEAEEKRLQLKMKCQRALVLARLYGGSALILGTNDADPMQPLRPEATKQGRPDLRPRPVALAAQPRPDDHGPGKPVVRSARVLRDHRQPGAEQRPAASVARHRLHRPEGSRGRLLPVDVVVLGRSDHAVDRRGGEERGPGAKRVRGADRSGAVDVSSSRPDERTSVPRKARTRSTDRVAWLSQAKSTHAPR